jgi:hypothetical protein
MTRWTEVRTIRGKCDWCAEPIKKYRYEWVRRTRHFCSLECAGMARREATAKSFWSKTENQPSGCIVWTRSKNPDGYGNLSWNGRNTRAHRVAYALAHGEIPQGMSVLHRCDNPPCCNPAHLFLGTQQDNIRDCVEKGRHWWRSANG